MPAQRSAVDLHDVTVLILEDDYYLANDLEDALTRCGAEQEAIYQIAADRPSCALLDINLGAGPSFDVADRLADLSIPFAFVTGYDHSTVPSRMSHVEQVQKPLGRDVAPELVRRLLA